MQIVASTFPALVLAALVVLRGPTRGLLLVMLALPFGAAAAFRLAGAGGASLTLPDLMVLSLAVAVLCQAHAGAQLRRLSLPGGPGFALLVLAACCIFATLLLPRVFEGATEVYGIARRAESRQIVLSPLAASTGNLTQIVRLLINVAAFFAAAVLLMRRAEPALVLRAVMGATLVHVMLGWADVASYTAGMAELLDPIRTAAYAVPVDQHLAGLKRMIGGFPEASSFGQFSLALFGFWLHVCLGPLRSRWSALGLALSTMVLLRSTSTAAYVAACLFVALYLALRCAKSFDGSLQPRTVRYGAFALAAVPLGLAGLILLYQSSPQTALFLDRALFDKLGTESGVERMRWNAQALTNLRDTFLLGAGLGSLRASNWLLACLGSIGVAGTAVYLWFIATLARLPAAGAETRPLVSALKASLLAQLCGAVLTFPTPNLGLTFFLFGGLATGLAVATQRHRDVAPAPQLVPLPHPSVAVSAMVFRSQRRRTLASGGEPPQTRAPRLVPTDRRSMG